MTMIRTLRGLLGVAAVAAMLGVMGCEDEDGDISSNPAVPAGVDISDNSESFMWKFQQDGAYGCSEPRLVTRWPSYLVRAYGVTGENSYVMAGASRLEFYRYDVDFGGQKPSYAICNRRPSDFVPNQRVVLYKDGKPFAFAIIADPGSRYFGPLP